MLSRQAGGFLSASPCFETRSCNSLAIHSVRFGGSVERVGDLSLRVLPGAFIGVTTEMASEFVSKSFKPALFQAHLCLLKGARNPCEPHSEPEIQYPKPARCPPPFTKPSPSAPRPSNARLRTLSCCRASTTWELGRPKPFAELWLQYLRGFRSQFWASKNRGKRT